MFMRPTALALSLWCRQSVAPFLPPLSAGWTLPSSSSRSSSSTSSSSSSRSSSSTSSSGPPHCSPLSSCAAPTTTPPPSPQEVELLVSSCLDEPNRERCQRELARRGLPGWSPAQGAARVNAAVLVSLCRCSGEPSLLLTLRSRAMVGRHSGEVCFPGGKQEEGDRGAVETALREAREELGVHVSSDCVWGLLTPVPDVMDKMMVWPVLADLGEIDAGTLNPNPDEVAEAFLVSLRHLCKPAHQGYTQFRAKGGHYAYTLPLFNTGHGLHDTAAATLSPSASSEASTRSSYRVWGLTAVMLDQALSVLLPDVYSSKLHGVRFSRQSGGNKGQTRVMRTDQ